MGKMSFSEFRQKLQCSFEDASSIIREASNKAHVFLAIDEFTKVLGHAGDNVSRLLELVKPLTRLLDRGLVDTKKFGRLNAVFSSLASYPLPKLRNFSGRCFKVRCSRPCCRSSVTSFCTQ
jgi:hypothetical protein